MITGNKTSPQWSRISELFERSLQLSGSERDWFLRLECGGDDALLSQVRALLTAHDRTGALDTLSLQLFADVGKALPDAAPPGSEIGPYRIVSELGSGGMGVVYLADQELDGLQRRVAIKVLRLGGSDDVRGLVPRFLAERAILARLEHQNIPRFLDGGLTREGSPYFAMEYVEGVPIDQYADKRRLGIRQRLSLLVSVCDAMQYAHQHLVVHRDLKPSNILVTSAGIPKVLDFGIAKLLDASDEKPITGIGQRWMTPDYASPEQVRGDPITTAADVFALGVLMYELLACRKPHPGRSRHDVERAILDTEPLRPSQAIEFAKCEAQGASHTTVRRELSGDLDTITLKALSKAPERRYATAGELADDIRRYLAGLPVRARPDTVGYRARKWVARHRGLVAALSISGVSIIAGTVATLEGANRAHAHARQAELERDRAERVSQFAVGLFAAADPVSVGPRDITARELLDSGAARLRRELGTQPERRAAMLEVLAQSYSGLGRSADAQATIAEAVALRRRPPLREAELAASLERQARILLAGGQADSAGAAAREALELRRRSGATPAVMAASLSLMGDFFHVKAQRDSAEHYLRAAIDGWKTASDTATHADMLANLAVVLSRRGRLSEAESLQTVELGLRRGYLAADHPAIASVISGRAITRLRLGRTAQARRDMHVALEMRLRSYGDRHPEVANTYHNLGRITEVDGAPDSARVLYARAAEIKLATRGPTHTSLARTYAALGALERRQRHFVAADSLLTRSLAIRRAALGDEHTDVAGVWSQLGALERDRGRPARALPLQDRALLVLRSKLPADALEVLGAEVEYAATLAALRRREEAELLLTRVRGRLAALGIQDPVVAQADSLLAVIGGDR